MNRNLSLSLIQTLFIASAADDIWKHCCKRRNCSQCVQLYLKLNLNIKILSIFFARLFKSHLLQMCCMWERVNNMPCGDKKIIWKSHQNIAEKWSHLPTVSPLLTHPHIQQLSSRQLWTYFVKKIENLYN